jgi:hypothetical protein
MYLPLTGFKDKEDFERKMSIDAIGPVASQSIEPLNKTDRPHQETRKIDTEGVRGKQEDQKVLDSGNSVVVDQHYSADSLSTQDFLVLKTQSTDEPYKVLDEVIAKMKEDIEDVGDAMETMAKLAEKTSKSNLALQIIEKTMEAMDKASGDR